MLPARFGVCIAFGRGRRRRLRGLHGLRQWRLWGGDGSGGALWMGVDGGWVI